MAYATIIVEVEMSGKDQPEPPEDDFLQQVQSPCMDAPSEQPPEVTPFTRSALRMVYPKNLPPTPSRKGSLSHRLRRLWRRLRSGR